MEDASFGEVNTEVGARWKALTDAEKVPYYKVCASVRGEQGAECRLCVRACLRAHLPSRYIVAHFDPLAPRPTHSQKAEKDKKRFEKEKAAFEKAGGVFQTKVCMLFAVCARLDCCVCMHGCLDGYGRT